MSLLLQHTERLLLCLAPRTRCVAMQIRCHYVKPKDNIHFHKMMKKVNPVDLALAHYDNFYSKVYRDLWPSIRLGLLSPNKYAALVNYFGDPDDALISLREQGAYNIQYIYEKNLRRILKHTEKKKFLKERRAAMLAGSDIPVPESRHEMLNSNVTSDSEFEQIGAFFTDSEGDTGGTFVNAAQMDLNLNDYVPVQEMNYQEEIVDDRGYYQFYDVDSEVHANVVDQNVLNYPTMLNLVTFPRNDFTRFKPAATQKSGLLDYYLLDCASGLPVLVLDIQDGDYVADFCAAPGGKALMLFETMKDCRFFLNEASLARFERMRNVFNSFVPRSSQQKIEFSHRNACRLNKKDAFDKILVDVPCTNDRHSLYENDNNIFSTSRINERVDMPSRQLDLLLSALESVKVGGTVVYSTCSLSPIQNDGVVHMALKNIWERSERSFSVVNLKEAMRPLRGIFHFSFQFKYGVQVLPFICSNFGPMYFSKLVRTN